MDAANDIAKQVASEVIAQGGLLGALFIGLVVLFLAVVIVMWRALQSKENKLVETLNLWREDTKLSEQRMSSYIDKTETISQSLSRGMDLVERTLRK